MSWYWWSPYDLYGMLKNVQVQLDRLETKINALTIKENATMVDLTSMTAEVAHNTDVTNSVLQLVNNMAAQIAAIPPSNDPVTQAALDDLKNTLTNNDKAIADSVTANTSAAPAT